MVPRTNEGKAAFEFLTKGIPVVEASMSRVNVLVEPRGVINLRRPRSAVLTGTYRPRKRNLLVEAALSRMFRPKMKG